MLLVDQIDLTTQLDGGHELAVVPHPETHYSDTDHSGLPKSGNGSEEADNETAVIAVGHSQTKVGGDRGSINTVVYTHTAAAEVMCALLTSPGGQPGYTPGRAREMHDGPGSRLHSPSLREIRPA